MNIELISSVEVSKKVENESLHKFEKSILTVIQHRVICPPILITATLDSPGHAQLEPRLYCWFRGSNMAASTHPTNDEIVGILNIIEDIIPRLNSLSDPDYVEGMALRFDVLKRYLVNTGIDDNTLEVVDSVCRSLNQFNQHYSASNNYASANLTYTGRHGKPSYNVDEGQFNFLLEQGFKVGEVSRMMGVSKRTLER